MPWTQFWDMHSGGEDYIITEYPTLEEATKYHRTVSRYGEREKLITIDEFIEKFCGEEAVWESARIIGASELAVLLGGSDE